MFKIYIWNKLFLSNDILVYIYQYIYVFNHQKQKVSVYNDDMMNNIRITNNQDIKVTT